MNRNATPLVLSAIAVVLSVIAVVLAAMALGRAPAEAPPPPPVEAPAPLSMDPNAEPLTDMAPADPNSTRIEYEIETDGQSVTSISYVGWEGDAPRMIDRDGAPAPFREVVDIPKGENLADFSVTGVGGSTSRQATCTIRVDGDVVDTQTASGAYAVVSCTAKP